MTGGGDFVPSHELIKAQPRVRKVADPRPGGSTTRSGSTTGGKIHDPADPRLGRGGSMTGADPRSGRMHDRGRIHDQRVHQQIHDPADPRPEADPRPGATPHGRRVVEELLRTGGELLRSYSAREESC